MQLTRRTLILLIVSATFFMAKYIIEIYINISWYVYVSDVIRLVLYPLMIPLCIICLTLAILFALSDLKTTRVQLEIEHSDIEKLRQRLFEDKTDAEKNKDILELMLSNMSEIKQYYSMSKKHAQLSFVLALLFCIFGFVLITFAITLEQTNTQPMIIGIIGGTISELFAGTALFVHRSSLFQLNHYYKSLHENERFLSTVNLVSQLSNERRDDAVMKIIDSSLKDISTLVNDTK